MTSPSNPDDLEPGWDTHRAIIEGWLRRYFADPAALEFLIVEVSGSPEYYVQWAASSDVFDEVSAQGVQSSRLPPSVARDRLVALGYRAGSSPSDNYWRKAPPMDVAARALTATRILADVFGLSPEVTLKAHDASSDDLEPIVPPVPTPGTGPGTPSSGAVREASQTIARVSGRDRWEYIEIEYEASSRGVWKVNGASSKAPEAQSAILRATAKQQLNLDAHSVMDALGEQGWEMVASASSGVQNAYPIVWLKRPKK